MKSPPAMVAPDCLNKPVGTVAGTTNGFFLLVDDRQIEDLDEEVVVTVESTISFVKLVPLVGG